MSPSNNIPRSKSIKERISNYLSKRIYGESEIPTDQNQEIPTEHRFSDLSQVQAVGKQPPPAKLGFRQRFIAEFNAALDSKATLKRSSTTWHRRPRQQSSIPQRSASTPHRRHNPEYSPSLRESSSVTRGRRHRQEALQRSSSTGHRQHQRKNSSPPYPIARNSSPQPLPRARSYRPTSFATKPNISTPLAFVDLNEYPVQSKNSNTLETPLTNRTDLLDRADFDVLPALRNQSKGFESPSTDQTPLHRAIPPNQDADDDSHPRAPRGTTQHSIISSSTHWGDFISEAQSNPASKPAFNQAAMVSPRQPQPRSRPQSPAKFPSFSPASHQTRVQSPLSRTPVADLSPPRQPQSRSRSKSPAKFPSFSPAAHQMRAQSPLSRKPVADPSPSFTRTPSNSRRSRRPVTCELCKGLSDPNVSYPEVERHLCSKCARIAFGDPGKAQMREGGIERAREGSEKGSRSTIVPQPPTPPVKDFADFNFAGSSVYPATPSSTGSQLKFDAHTTTTTAPAAAAAVEKEPFDTYQSSPTNVKSYYPPASVHHPRPPSSEYSNALAPAANRYKSNIGNPYASTLGNLFTNPNPFKPSSTVERTVGGSTTPPPPPHRKPTLPPIRTNFPVSDVSSSVTTSPHPHTRPFIPMSLPPPNPSRTANEQHSDNEEEEEEEDGDWRSVNRPESFYYFWDDLLGGEKGVRSEAGGEGANKDKGKRKEREEWWDE